jgi:hypothetical protein
VAPKPTFMLDAIGHDLPLASGRFALAPKLP